MDQIKNNVDELEDHLDHHQWQVGHVYQYYHRDPFASATSRIGYQHRHFGGTGTAA
jgi:hypothetical protein